jgi:transcriptional regulator PpsR
MFRSPRKLLGALDADAAAQLVSASSDIAMVIDRKGIIRDVSGEEKVAPLADWIGRSWLETVTVESRPKVQEMLAEAGVGTLSRARQVNHPVVGGADLPVRYSALGIGSEGRVIAFGRELRSMSDLQQQLVAAEQQVEREYQRLKATETRYRALFKLASEAVLITDATTLKVVEANPAAVDMLANGSRRIVGRLLTDLVSPRDQRTLEALIASVRALPRADDIEVALANAQRHIRMSAALFQEEQQGFLLVRLRPLTGVPAESGRREGSSLSLGVMAHLPEGLVILDSNRRILSANAAFIELTELATEEQVRGQPIERWLGRIDVDVDILFATLRENGSVRRFSTAIRGEYGGRESVEISGVAVEHGTIPCTALSLRQVVREPASVGGQGQTMLRSVDQLTELVGRMPLKELVRETTDIIERMCIEAALQLTGDNRASAAEMLGLSRQSLYVKLRRYGLGELDGQPE